MTTHKLVPVTPSEAMLDSVRGVLQAIRCNPGVTYCKVKEHCSMRGDDITAWPQWADAMPDSYVTEQGAASLIHSIMLSAAPVDDGVLVEPVAWMYLNDDDPGAPRLVRTLAAAEECNRISVDNRGPAGTIAPLYTALSRPAVLEEAAKICEKAARTYRSMKVDEDGDPTPDENSAEEFAHCCELNARDIRAAKGE